mmetsp:Transcript_2053/g.2964  ORF Transcript_2053/g.2964 Transcript_2053/m.2964 type:complete len:96 (-) Transcript_2053:964-1251(-)
MGLFNNLRKTIFTPYFLRQYNAFPILLTLSMGGASIYLLFFYDFEYIRDDRPTALDDLRKFVFLKLRQSTHRSHSSSYLLQQELAKDDDAEEECF